MTNPQQITMPSSAAAAPDLSLVVIGYNEGDNLGRCIASIRRADLAGFASEIIYVDGGSQDSSLQIAREAGADAVVGGEKRRRAAENRNLGLSHARGRFVQFIDGDMIVAPHWPRTAMAFLEDHPETAVVYGDLEEANKSLIFRALQLDWAPFTGVVKYCGGAAMFRRAPLAELGGFPEDVAYGEEPCLCWRIRNERGMTVYHLTEKMADHDLGFRGFRDYWRRCVRTGATYAEISFRFRRTNDPLWWPETRNALAWGGIILLALVLVLVGPWWWLRATIAAALLLLLLRKFVQTVRRGNDTAIAAVYAAHTYFAKVPIAWGAAKWLLTRKKPAC